MHSRRVRVGDTAHGKEVELDATDKNSCWPELTGGWIECGYLPQLKSSQPRAGANPALCNF